MNPIENIKNRLSILDVVSTYVRLDKSGNQYKGRCPFHNEKTPSFYVSPAYGWFNCFGCGKKGDIFTFIEEIEHIPFREALAMLAEKAGVELKSYSKKNEGEVSYFDILESATNFYVSNLRNNPTVKMYLHERKIADDSIDNFRIGFAKDEWRSLRDSLVQKGFRDEDIEKAGLTIKTEKGYYDRFRGRVMFPITNQSGKVAGFTGRITPETQAKTDKLLAKYVNTPETDLYHKSKILFGFDLAKKYISEQDECIVVEGQVDVIMAHQINTRNTVAVSGTSFTEEQLRLIKRLTNNITFCLDSDKAGYESLKRSASIAHLLEMDVKVIDLGEDKDPADMIKESPDTWREAVSRKIDVISYIIRKQKLHLLDKTSISKVLQKEVFPLIWSIQSAISKNVYLEILSKEIDLPLDTVKIDFDKYSSTLSTDQGLSGNNDITLNTTPSISNLKKTYLRIKNEIQISEQSTKDKYSKIIEEVISKLSKNTQQELDIPLDLEIIFNMEFEKQNLEVNDKRLEESMNLFYEQIILFEINELQKDSTEINLVEQLKLQKKLQEIRNKR